MRFRQVLKLGLFHSRDFPHSLSSQIWIMLINSLDRSLDSVTHEAPVVLHVSRHSALIHQWQLTTCLFGDRASCDDLQIPCSCHNTFLFNVASLGRHFWLINNVCFFLNPSCLQCGWFVSVNWITLPEPYGWPVTSPLPLQRIFKCKGRNNA